MYVFLKEPLSVETDWAWNALAISNKIYICQGMCEDHPCSCQRNKVTEVCELHGLGAFLEVICSNLECSNVGLRLFLSYYTYKLFLRDNRPNQNFWKVSGGGRGAVPIQKFFFCSKWAF